MKVAIFNNKLVSHLYDKIEDNLSLYLEGDFHDYLSSSDYSQDIKELKGVNVNEAEFASLNTI